MRIPLHGLALGATLALVPIGLAAQESDPTAYPECTKQVSDADRDAAKAAFNVGKASFDEADYARAIQYWEDAYRRDCTAHMLLLNLARAFESNGQKRHAVSALEAYLARSGDTAQKDQILRRIQVIREKIAAEQPVVPTATAPTPTATSTAPAPAPTGEPPPATGKKPVLPIIVAVGGGVVAAVGAGLYFTGKADVDDVEAACPNRKCPTGRQDLVDKGESGRSKQTTGGILAVGGLVVGVGGLIWYIAAPRQGAPAQSARRTSVDPAVGPGFTGLVLSGAF